MAENDSEVQRHMETWVGFGRFLLYSAVSVVVVLVLMAIFLL